MKRILVNGSLAYDVLLGSDGSFLDSIKDAKDEVSVVYLAHHIAQHHGGTGVNITWSLNLLGADPLLVSTIGSDGEKYTALLEERGISTEFIDRRDDVLTATAIIGTDSQENQIGFFHPGADGLGEWPDLSSVSDDIAVAIISPRNEALMIAGAVWCHEQGIPVYFDPGQRLSSMSTDDLDRLTRLSTGVIVNEYEWSLLQEKLGCTEENFASLCPLLIVTRGADGVTYFNEEGAQNIGACPTEKVVNPTGAGDAFRAGLLYGLTNEWSLLHSCRLGAAIGSFAVEYEGTLLDVLDTESVWNRAKESYGEDLPM